MFLKYTPLPVLFFVCISTVISQNDVAAFNSSIVYSQASADCLGAPVNLTASAVGFHDILVGWQNDENTTDWELELQTDMGAFDGTPHFSGSGNSFVIPDLTSNKQYFWRVRNVCENGPSQWSAIKQFRTPMSCDDATDLPCTVLIQAQNLNQLGALNTCGGASNGMERFYRITPDYSGEFDLESLDLRVRYLIKPLNSSCDSDTGWTCIGTGQGIWSMGVLTGGQTYILAQDFFAFADYGQTNGRFRVFCPLPCVKPSNLQVIPGYGSTNLTWNAQPNQVSWQIEVRPVGVNLSSTPNYTSTQNNLVITDLLPSSRYHAQVRGLCGSLGNSVWSSEIQFLTLPDCGAYPLLACDQMVSIPFTSGASYWTSFPACDISTSGTERILQFIPDGPTRYIFVPYQESFGFYLKKAGTSPCESVNDWQCVGNTSSVIITLDGLEPGALYYLLCKKQFLTATTLQLSFHCSFPCVTPSNPVTSIISTNWVDINWTQGDGPWKYEVALRYPDGTEQYHSNISPSANTHKLTDWFTITNNEIHSWRVRTICNNGDTSAWSSPAYFRLPFCLPAEKIPCSDTLYSLPTEQRGYHYLDKCGGKKYGQQRIYKLNAYAGAQTLQFFFDNPSTVNYSRVQTNNEPCNEDWIPCTSLTNGGSVTINAPEGGVYYIQLTTSDTTLPLAPTIVATCFCHTPTNGKGVLYSDSTAVLTWGSFSSSDTSFIEIVPIGNAFTGIPDYIVTDPPLTISGLDPYQIYSFRVRSRCGATGFSGWSDTFQFRLQIDCAMSYPECGSVFEVELGYASNSLFDLNICGVHMYGDETFFRIQPDFSGYYELQIVDEPFSNNRLYLAFLDGCEHPGSPLTCIGNGGFVGIYSLGYLEEGQSYMLVAAYESPVNGDGIYKMRLNCSWPNDAPGLLTPDSPFFIPVDDSCRVFRNRWASGGFPDPDPSTPPGNWRDGPQRSVWFAFTAPLSGTVEISALSEASEPFDPQIALLSYDTLGGSIFRILASGEDNAGEHPADAILTYTGLVPGNTYYILVDGANGSGGSFCLRIRDEPEPWLMEGVCETFVQPDVENSITPWINLYATGDDPHVNGPLLGAIRTQDDLGVITVSTEILPDAPVLSGDQKLLPRYFNIETEFQPQHPVTLRLFFTAADLETFNITPPASSVTPFQLGLTHYDGADEDCDPSNNALTAGLSVNASQAMLVGENGIFYLEAVFNQFSEFGAALSPVSDVDEVPNPLFGVTAAPNPFTQSLQLSIQSSVSARLDLLLFDVLARPVYKKKCSVNPGENTETVDLSDVAPGIYQLIVQDGGNIRGKIRLVKI